MNMTTIDRIKCGLSLALLLCLFWVPLVSAFYSKFIISKLDVVEYLSAEYHDYFNYIGKCWSGVMGVSG